MKYNVTLQTKVVSENDYIVEAATENEATLTAIRMATAILGLIDHVDVLSVNEVEPTDVLNRPLKQGYLRGII